MASEPIAKNARLEEEAAVDLNVFVLTFEGTKEA